MQGGKVLEEMEIGYIEDFEKLKEKQHFGFTAMTIKSIKVTALLNF